MSIFIYNVLTRKKEEFIPLEKGKIKMYACGITVSGDAHIGHAYQAVIFDVIKKYFKYKGYAVTYVRNYTDVDDKIIAKGIELGVDPQEYANSQIVKTDLELKKLGNDKPTVQARATENINEMIDFIEKLIEKDYAYATEFGDVFFSVKKYTPYGKLSNRSVEDSISGVRKDTEPGKIDKSDLNIVDGIFEETEKHIYNFYKIFYSIDNLKVGEESGCDKQSNDFSTNIKIAFNDEMSNDFNTSVALSYLFEYFNKMNVMIGKNKDICDLKSMKETIIKIYSILGILQDEPQKAIEQIKNKYMKKYEVIADEVESMIIKRSEYKSNKDYENADKIKQLLLEKGIIILDGLNGTEWDINIKVVK